MIKIELVRFEAQDVITASGVVAPTVPEHVDMNDCTNPTGHSGQVVVENGVANFKCVHCGADVSASGSITG